MLRRLILRFAQDDTSTLGLHTQLTICTTERNEESRPSRILLPLRYPNLIREERDSSLRSE